jgi:hypothetical protein
VREILGFLKIWRYKLGLFVEMCLICYIFGAAELGDKIRSSLPALQSTKPF